MHIVIVIALGVVVAVLARLLGFASGPAAWREHLRWAGLVGSSVAGSVIGSKIAAVAVVGDTAQPAAYVMAISGAMMLVAVYEALAYRSAIS